MWAWIKRYTRRITENTEIREPEMGNACNLGARVSFMTGHAQVPVVWGVYGPMPSHLWG